MVVGVVERRGIKELNGLLVRWAAVGEFAKNRASVLMMRLNESSGPNFVEAGGVFIVVILKSGGFEFSRGRQY